VLLFFYVRVMVDIEIRFSTYGIYEFFQCFDTVGWVTGRASGL